jgi:hypothetical protein
VANRGIDAQSTYSDKLFALIPGEITAAFLAVHSIVDSNTTEDNTLLVIVVIVLMILNIPYLIKFQNLQNKMQLAFTSGAFLLWAASIENSRLSVSVGLPSKYIAVTMVLYTLCIPFAVKS